MCIRLKYSNLKHFAFLYIALPLCFFSIGYLKPWIAVVVTAGVLLALWRGAHEPNVMPGRDKMVEISLIQMGILFVIMLLWTYLGGLNGCFYQSDDWQIRNAIFRDMITHEWPVTYNNGSALTYYIAFWMPPAAIGRLIYLLTGELGIAWSIGNNMLWIWTTVGQFLISLLLIVYLGAHSVRKQIVTIVIFVLFSGLDVVGVAIRNAFAEYFAPNYLHLEWWAGSRQFSSITTCLYWVFNQAVVPWLAVMCFLFEKDARNYLLIGSSCLICGPFPFVGLVLCMIVRWAESLVNSIKRAQWKQMLKKTFSLQNVVVLLTALPPIALYFVSNYAFSQGVGTAATAFGVQTEQSVTLLESIANYVTLPLIAFLGLEVGVYLMLLWWKYRRNTMFYAIGLMFAILPYFRIGVSADFCMRTTIPPIFILMIMVMESVLEGMDTFKTDGRNKRLALCSLVATLCIGAVTPGVEIYRGIYNVITEGTVMLAKDDQKTLDVPKRAYNFVAACYPDKPFYKYLAPHTNRVLINFEDGFESPDYGDGMVSRATENGAVMTIYNDCAHDQSGTLSFEIVTSDGSEQIRALAVSINGIVTEFTVADGTKHITVPLNVPAASKTSIVFSIPNWVQRYNAAFVVRNVCFEDENGNLLSGVLFGNEDFYEYNVVVVK